MAWATVHPPHAVLVGEERCEPPLHLQYTPTAQVSIGSAWAQESLLSTPRDVFAGIGQAQQVRSPVARLGCNLWLAVPVWAR
mmetsp:Transcript_115471/g.216226  ORF Transcript_115471/g.216226 Transcript_115471/m.216226 type:complete len:82 (+) Transcript_115471:740-985(+)